MDHRVLHGGEQRCRPEGKTHNDHQLTGSGNINGEKGRRRNFSRVGIFFQPFTSLYLGLRGIEQQLDCMFMARSLKAGRIKLHRDSGLVSGH